MSWHKLKGPLIFKSVSLIPLSIFFAKILEVILRYFGINFTSHTDSGTSTFVSNFIEWFGVLYGILLPLILVRVWEQLDDIDREFDREADEVKLLYEDIFYLKGKNASYGKEIADELRKYVLHVIENYRYEVKLDNHTKQSNNKTIRSIKKYLGRFIRFEYENSGSDTKRIAGDKIIERIRMLYKNIISTNTSSTNDPYVSEIFHRLNGIVDIRGDRIGFASQRLFQSLRLVSLITSITFVIPFYFVGFNPNTPLLDNLLIISVTILVIFIYMIIDDFDEPFGGTWRITDASWKRTLEYMNDPNRQRELSELITEADLPENKRGGQLSNLREQNKLKNNKRKRNQV